MVVVTRPGRAGDLVGPGVVLVTRFWHRRDRPWSENFFESLDYAIRPFVDESGWILLQRQQLAGEHEPELIFRGRPEDFDRGTPEELLKDVGLTPEDVEKLLQGDRP